MTSIGQDNAKGVRIRHAEVDDAAVIQAIISQEGCYPNTTLLPYYPVANWQERLTNMAEGEYHLIAEKEGTPFAALMIMVPKLARRKHTAMFGITISETEQGKGMGALLMQYIMDFCTNWLAITRIELETNADNLAAIALYKKCGFEIESTSKRSLFRDGEYIDSYKMAKVIDIKKPRESKHYQPQKIPLAAQKKLDVAHCKIRHSETRDAQQIQALYGQESCYANTLQLPFPSEKSWQEKLNRMENSLVIEYQGKIIGQAGLFTSDRQRRKHSAGLGMAISDIYRGQGVGAKLLDALLDLAINWMAMTRIELEVYVDNEAGIALYKKFGFEIEGQAKRFAFRAGEYVDVYYMAKLID